MGDWPHGVGREIHAELDSTNAEALRQARLGAGPRWILAHRQSAARGRRGRRWTTGEGNFAATLLMTPPGGPAQAALRSFVAGLALHDALVAALGGPADIRMKWPNDLLAGGRKLAGILLETAGAPFRLAVGIGVNLASVPEVGAIAVGALAPTSVLAATGRHVAAEALLDRLAPAFAAWEARLEAEGFAPLREAWLARAAHLGGPIVARVGGAEHIGRFESIDVSGALVLAGSGGRIVLPAADVHFAPLVEGFDAARD